MVGAAHRFVERFRPEAKVLLFGHFHRPGLWERGGRYLCNSGAFMRACRPQIAELNGGYRRIRQGRWDGSNYVPGDARAVIRMAESQASRRA